MIRPPLLLLILGACAASGLHAPAQARAPAVCNGKHRRPANPYSSVLASGLKPAAVGDAAASPAPSPSPSPATRAARVSRAGFTASYAPCGGRA